MTADFDWQLHPDAEAFVDSIVDAATAQSPRLADFRAELSARTSTRIQDWLDHVAAPVTPAQLLAVGYVDGWQSVPGVWRHPGAQLPAMVIADRYRVALRVDDAAAALHALGADRPVLGSPLSAFRSVVVSDDGGTEVVAVERRSWSAGVTPVDVSLPQRSAASQAWQVLAERPRTRVGASGVAEQLAAARTAVALVGADLAASYFLQLEREFWQRSNTAGMLQHARQDRLGLGWGNNDHHTFRSSRAAFHQTIQFLAALGFQLRERFYAGTEAGWGAQVLEHPGCGGVIFADVDLTPAEMEIDFAQTPLVDGTEYGTVGMWCALHGESILESGMHHLEGQFEFDGLRDQLADRGVLSMAPFSDFTHLRQAFTEAEVWKVPQERLGRLVAEGQLSAERAGEIGRDGAAGSHLENLARRAGFKGFNQHNVSTTMRATHPRDYRPQ
ncbi:MAG: hypothetical protein ACR2KJ_05260 [Jatrophihabitans sp.]